MTAAVESGRQKVETIEAARGIAALAVVVFHANAAARFVGERSWDILGLGEHGVDFFFVLSGFIIFFVHSGDIGRPDRAKDYALKRFIRLFPLLWLVVGAWILLRILMGSPPAPDAVATSLLLYPSMVEPMPLVVWTLRHEALFYCAFLVLILNRRLGIGLFGVWTLAVLTQLVLALLGRPIEGLPAFFLSSYQIDFVLGASVALLHRNRRFAGSWWPLAAACALVLLLFIVEERVGLARNAMLDYTSAAATGWTVLLGCAFALVLHGLLRIEARVRVPRSLLLLGAASYSIYLVHTPVNSVAQRVAVFLPTGLSHLFIIAAGVGAGILVHFVLERPIASYLRTKLMQRRPSRSTQVAPQTTSRRWQII